MRINQMLMGALALVCACAFGGDAKELGVKGETPGAAAQKLQMCGFLLNKDFKKNAKYYLCLFSASWCGPCRREMPRIAKTYAESLKDDSNVELIHFSWDQNDEKALAWAKEHDVKFPVVKPNGGNPLDLHTRGIPHLFIVDADGKLLEKGHPARLFTNEKLNALKAGTYTVPETATEKTRKAIAKLFPGWSLDTEVWDHDWAGIQSFHRGKSNVTFVHPKNRETPSAISRTVKLSGNNPCLSLSVASWNDDADFLLSVRVNGKDALSNRIVCTTDAVPWEDIIVPLSAWCGSMAKIEIVFTCNGWSCEFPYLSRVDIVEADGDMSIKEGKCEVDGYTWSYRAQNGEATIVAENDGRFSAVSPCPVGTITIPATLAGAKVTQIGRGAFLECSTMTSVTVPEGVLRIGRDAFRDCTGLKSIKIPPSVTIIERDAFAGCNGLSSVSIPKGVTRIDRGAFYWCCGLGSIEIPSSVTQIGRDAFSYCLGLSSITIPENVTDIGRQAFRVCKALASVTIPASVTNIDNSAFCDTGALTSFHVAPGNRFYKSENGLLLTKDGTTLVRGINGDAVIPPSVTAIGACAFEGCVALRSVAIPPGVKSIGPFAFKHCRGMKSVTIPSSVTEIGFEAFRDCRGLTSVTIPSSVTSIESDAFNGTPFYDNMSDGMVVLGGGVLYRYKGAHPSTVAIPSTVTSIAAGSFSEGGFMRLSRLRRNGSGLQTVVISSSVTKIGDRAFSYCGDLASVTMLGERPEAPNNIFQNCNKLKAIHVPANAKSWAGMKEWQKIPLVFDGEDAGRQAQAESSPARLGGLARLRQRRMEMEAERREAAERKREANAASKAEQAEREAREAEEKQRLAEERAQQREAIRQIQEQLRRQRGERDPARRRAGQAANAAVQIQQATVDGYTWSYCVNDGAATIVAEKDDRFSCAVSPMPDEDVKIPATLGGVKVTSIGKGAFRNCKGLTSVTIPSSVTNIAENAFKDRRGILCENVRIRDGFNGPKSFSVDSDNPSYSSRNGMLCTKDGSILIIGVNGDVVIPEGVTSIGNGAFYGCSGLTSVSIPEGVTSIGDGAFYSCRVLTSVSIPEGVTSIGDGAFYGCRGLASVSIPNSVTNIGAAAFYGCSGRMSIAVGDGNANFRSINGLLLSKDGTTLLAGVNGSVTIPSSVTRIGGGAFRYCRSLTSVTIPDGVASVGDYAFFGCSGLTSVTIPDSVTNIGVRAFSGCNGLANVTMRGGRPEALKDIFPGCGKLKAIHVPANAKSWAGMKEWQGIPLVFDAK